MLAKWILNKGETLWKGRSSSVWILAGLFADSTLNLSVWFSLMDENSLGCLVSSADHSTGESCVTSMSFFGRLAYRCRSGLWAVPPQMEPYLGGAIITGNPLGTCLENSGPVYIQSFPLSSLELVGKFPYRLEPSPDFQKFWFQLLWSLAIFFWTDKNECICGTCSEFHKSMVHRGSQTMWSL